jgi:2-C-methyl-D-erythritol 2,4-cyclodiphosphate synthase
MFRVGIGHDTHRLLAGRRLVIGGVEIPHTHGSVAHSDGDVLLHAITDAILGALAWGDIGEWFPDDDPQHAGADSAQLLQQVVDRAHGHGWKICNIDGIVFAQRPKLLPFKPAIRQRIAEILRIAAEQVSVKAKTGEKVGPVGREEAICAEAVVLLMRPSETAPFG